MLRSELCNKLYSGLVARRGAPTSVFSVPNTSTRTRRAAENEEKKERREKSVEASLRKNENQEGREPRDSVRILYVCSRDVSLSVGLSSSHPYRTLGRV